MILQPLPLLVLPTPAPPFWPLRSCRPENILKDQALLVYANLWPTHAPPHRSHLVCAKLESADAPFDTLHSARASPAKAHPCANPQDPVESTTPITPWSASPIFSHRILWNEPLDHLPLLFG